MEVPKELQDCPALHDSHVQRDTALNEAGQGQTEIREPQGQGRPLEIQESQEVRLVCGT